jgi:hypothetical protein
MKSGKNPSCLVAWCESLFPLAEGWRGRLQTTRHLITRQQVHDIAEKSGIKIFWPLDVRFAKFEIMSHVAPFLR